MSEPNEAERRRQKRMEKIAQRSNKSIESIINSPAKAPPSSPAPPKQEENPAVQAPEKDLEPTTPNTFTTDDLKVGQQSLEPQEDQQVKEQVIEQREEIGDAVETKIGVVDAETVQKEEVSFEEKDATVAVVEDEFERVAKLKKEHALSQKKNGPKRSAASALEKQYFADLEGELAKMDNRGVYTPKNLFLAASSVFLFFFRVLYVSLLTFFSYRISIRQGRVITNENIYTNLHVQRRFIFGLLGLGLAGYLARQTLMETCTLSLKPGEQNIIYSDDSGNNSTRYAYNTILDNLLNLGLRHGCISVPNLLAYFLLAEIPISLYSVQRSLRDPSNLEAATPDVDEDPAELSGSVAGLLGGKFSLLKKLGSKGSMLQLGLGVVKGFIPAPIRAAYAECASVSDDFSICLFAFTLSLAVLTHLVH